MIGALRGVVVDRRPDELCLEVAGIGYRVAVTGDTAAEIASVGAEVFLWIHHHIREDAQQLYGFAGLDERDLFETLIGTHGVGPSLALAILSVHSPRALRLAVATEDVEALCLVPGVGRKTAARLLIELTSRLDLGEVDLTVPASVGANGAAGSIPHADVREALTGLGYGPEEVGRAVAELPADGDAAELLRLALRRLAVA